MFRIFSWFDSGISFKTQAQISLVQIVIWDNSSTTFKGIEFICWMDEMHTHMR